MVDLLWYPLIATFHVKEGMLDEVVELLKGVVPTIRESEPGCLASIPHTVHGEGNENTIVFYEKY
jgi:quinol monooxygenase YgiN